MAGEVEEIGRFDTLAKGAGVRESGGEKAAAATYFGAGMGSIRQIGDGQAEDFKAGICIDDILCGLVVVNAAGAQLP
jgi:hypothetical protein